MDHYTHDYQVEALNGDQMLIPVDKGHQTDEEVARALAQRLTSPTGVMWGALARDDDDNDPGPWVVIPAASIAAVTIRRRPPVPVAPPMPAPAIDTYDPGAVSPAPAPVTAGSAPVG